MTIRAKGATEIDLVLQVHAETDKAWLVSDDGDKRKAKWMARSQAEIGDRKGPALYEFTLPEWIAVNNGWV